MKLFVVSSPAAQLQPFASVCVLEVSLRINMLVGLMLMLVVFRCLILKLRRVLTLTFLLS